MRTHQQALFNKAVHRERMAARAKNQLNRKFDEKYRPVTNDGKYIPAGVNRNIPADHR